MTPLNWQDHDLAHPLSLTEPHRIDVPDIFGDGYDDATRDQYFAVMALTPRHTYMLATEHPQVMADYLSGKWLPHSDVLADGPTRRFARIAIAAKELVGAGDISIPPLPNFLPGVLVRTQREADERVPMLLYVQAEARFVLCELREAVDLSYFLPQTPKSDCPAHMLAYYNAHLALHWLRVRGGVVPVHPDWVRSLRDQCAAAGVPFAFESWGDWVVASDHNLIRFGRQWDADDADCCWLDADGRTKRGSSHGLSRSAYAMIRVGRAASGRLLDGVLHDAYPHIESEVGR